MSAIQWIPLRWRKPRRVFVDSMSDLFHPDVPEEFIANVWATMAATPHHIYQILTKRPQRMAKMLGHVDGEGWRTSLGFTLPLPNVWLGTSVEDDRYAKMRVPYLLATPASVRFLSVEPLLGPVDLTSCLGWRGACGVLHEDYHSRIKYENLGRYIDWVIVGGESGPGARPMRVEWAEEVIAKCRAAGVPVFVKQLGSVWAREHGATDRKGGDPAEWPEQLRVREYPAEAVVVA